MWLKRLMVTIRNRVYNFETISINKKYEQENGILTKGKMGKKTKKIRIYGSLKYKCNERAISQSISNCITFEWIKFTFKIFAF